MGLPVLGIPAFGRRTLSFHALRRAGWDASQHVVDPGSFIRLVHSDTGK